MMDFLVEHLNFALTRDNGLFTGIIAINMTVIGLTSLAEKKTVIGIDYGEFLIKEFKMLGFRMYYWLILFALTNIFSLFTLFVEVPIVRIVNFFLLVCSLIFAICYFFGFVLVESKFVRQEIYRKELLGLYRDSDDTKHFPMDNIVGMNSGTRTSNKLSTNIINYFSEYNFKTQRVFEEVFGSDSIVYSSKKSILKARKKLFGTLPYRYRTSPDNMSIKEISFEFFQMFRFVDHQDMWAIDILKIQNGEPNSYVDYDIYRLYNFARMAAQVKTFGTCENLFKYKFLFHLSNYWLATVDASKTKMQFDEFTQEHIKEVEAETVKAIYDYVSKSIKLNENQDFLQMVRDNLTEIFINNNYKGFLTKMDIIKIICSISIEQKSNPLMLIIEDIINDCLETKEIGGKGIKLDELKQYISDIEKESNKHKRIMLFNNVEGHLRNSYIC